MNLCWPFNLRLFARGSVAAASGPFGGHATLTDGLVSYWKLDEQSGVRYDTITASANDLTDNNTVGYVNLGPSGVVANSVQANTEYLEKTSVDLFGSGSWTFTLWMNTEDNGDAASSILLQNVDVTGTYGFRYHGFSRGAFSNNWSVISGDSTATLSLALDTGWHFIAGWFDAVAGKTYLSVDNGTAIEGSARTTSQIVGRLRVAESTNSQVGRVGVWSAVLSSTERTALYNSGRGKLYSDLTAAEKVGLVSYWNLDEVSGVRYDSHGSNDLTDNNTVTSVINSYPANMPGVVANFVEGNNEHLSRVNASLVNWPQGDFHFALWAIRTGTDADTENNYASKLTSTGDQREWRIQTAGGQDRLYLYASSDGTSEDVSSNTGAGSFPITNWTFLELRRSGTTIGVAVNGGAFADGTLSDVFNSTAAFVLGARNSGSFGYLDGKESSAMIWNRVLTAQERTDLFNAGNGLFYNTEA